MKSSTLSRRRVREDYEPIGSAWLLVKGGILRAEQVLELQRTEYYIEERIELKRRIELLKHSAQHDDFPSTPRAYMRKNAKILLGLAEEVLCRLDARLKLTMKACK